MSVRIRLTKTGRKHQISFRIVVQDSKSKRDGRFLEILGSYNPHSPNEKINIKKERIKYWLSKGAKPTNAVNDLIKNPNK